MQKQLYILVLDDEATVVDRLKASLEAEERYIVETFVEPIKAMKRINEKEFDIVITDIRMKDVDGIEILEHIRTKSDRTKVLMITGYATMELAREAMSCGAFDFIAKPFKLKEIKTMVGKAADALDSESQS